MKERTWEEITDLEPLLEDFYSEVVKSRLDKRRLWWNNLEGRLFNPIDDWMSRKRNIPNSLVILFCFFCLIPWMVGCSVLIWVGSLFDSYFVYRELRRTPHEKPKVEDKEPCASQY